MKQNTTLYHVDLDDNLIGPEGAKAIEAAFFSNIFTMLTVKVINRNARNYSDRNAAIREILKRQANRIQTTEDIQTLQTYHDQLPNGLSRAYLATLLRGTIDSFYDFNKRLVHTDPMSLDCFDNCFPYNLNPS